MEDHTGISPFPDIPDTILVYDTTTSDASLAGFQYAGDFDELRNITFYHTIIVDDNWDKEFEESQDVLEMMANEATEEIKAGLAEEIGWDEL